MPKSVGESIPRYDGIGHVTGKTLYVDDVKMQGMQYIKVLRSPVHKGIIKNLDVSGAEAMPGVSGVITAKDIPGANAYGQGDQPVFAWEGIRYKGEKIAAVAAVDEQTAWEAVQKIKLDIEEQTPVFDPLEALKPDSPKVTPDGNIFGMFQAGDTFKVRVGDVDKGFAESDFVQEGTYTDSVNYHAPIEPHVSVAYMDGDNRLAIHTVSQCMYNFLMQLCGIFALPMNKVRYIGGTVGGGFGGKNYIHCDHVTGLMALKIKKPVKYRLTREEELLCSGKRGNYVYKIKTGVKKDGRIMARKASILHDSGAYMGFSPLAVMKNAQYIFGPYWIPNVWIDGQMVFTNRPPSVSMRGFGAVNPESAGELDLNRLAEAAGIDPWRIRLVNAFREGEEGVTQNPIEAAGVVETLHKAAELAGVDLPTDLKSMTSQRR